MKSCVNHDTRFFLLVLGWDKMTWMGWNTSLRVSSWGGTSVPFLLFFDRKIPWEKPIFSKNFVRRCSHDSLADHFMRAMHENLQWWSLEITIMNAMIAIITIMAQRLITTMTNSHYGGNLSVMMMVGICQWQNPTIGDDEQISCSASFFSTVL